MKQSINQTINRWVDRTKDQSINRSTTGYTRYWASVTHLRFPRSIGMWRHGFLSGMEHRLFWRTWRTHSRWPLDGQRRWRLVAWCRRLRLITTTAGRSTAIRLASSGRAFRVPLHVVLCGNDITVLWNGREEEIETLLPTGIINRDKDGKQRHKST